MNPEPGATYRLQLRPGFDFDRAVEVTAYLSALGVSHLFASPYLQAAAGSIHGYDVVDPTRVNPELGGARAHRRLCEKLRETGLGQMLDVVPNHMAIAGRQNPWWWDVLENGPLSRFAAYFDLDWKACERRWPNRVLLPVLGDHYGRVLEKGEIFLVREDGAFVLKYHDHVFPVDPASLEALLNRAARACRSAQLAFLADSQGKLARDRTPLSRPATQARHRDQSVLLDLVSRLCREKPEVAGAIDAEVARLNQDPDALDALIGRQNYRLSFWRAASRDLGYRRFFDINDLAGVRVEEDEVFHAGHDLTIGWVHKGWIQGLRIDHPDGLRDPAGYFSRLRQACPDAWILAEKILQPGEKLPSDWPISGTTGYDFINRVDGIFVDPDGEAPLTRIYEAFIGEKIDFAGLVCTCKRLVLDELFGSELNRLTEIFLAVCERHRRHRDYTYDQLHDALRETAACFPVYRSYVRAADGHVAQRDVDDVTRAVDRVMAQRPDLDPDLLLFLKEVLLLRVTGEPEGELAMRFQQLSSATMAKGLEDTAFYRYHRLVALNEVGGDPGRFGTPVEQFHQAMVEAQAERPAAMLASTTHDTKRSEDVRARLLLLSEIPGRWDAAVNRWADYNARHRHGDVPDRNTEYLLYQTLVGAWPIDVTRLTVYMEKAVREAKVHTSWTAINEAYETGLREFIAAIMADDGFRADLEEFLHPLLALGRINALAQTLIKLTAPGVPDIYQGTELWDLSLVDPDNRRPVDFGLRKRLLDELRHLSAEAILTRWDEGLPKLWLIRQALGLRRERPELFGPQGSYRPITALGARAGHVVAFMRGEAAISIVPRLSVKLAGEWGDTCVELPSGRWRNALAAGEWGQGPAEVKALLTPFPVSLLIRKE